MALLTEATLHCQTPCAVVSPTELAHATRYIAEKLEVSEASVHVETSKDGRDIHCFVPLDIVISHGPPPFKMYLSPDHTVITAEIYDVTENPLIAREAIRKEALESLDKSIFIDSGNPSASFSLTVFLDFQCPFCRRYNSALKTFASEHASNAHIVYRFYPLDAHPWAFIAAINAACVASQDKSAFFKLIDVFYDKQAELSPSTVSGVVSSFIKSQSLDEVRFKTCIASQQGKTIVEQDISLGKKLGVAATPTSFVNGRKLEGALSALDLNTLLQKVAADDAHKVVPTS